MQESINTCIKMQAQLVLYHNIISYDQELTSLHDSKSSVKMLNITSNCFLSAG